MNRNLFGLVIFTIILGTSVLFYYFFSPAIQPTAPTEPFHLKVTNVCELNECKNLNVTSARVLQAEIDSQSKTLQTNLRLQTQTDFSSSGNFVVALHVFKRNSNNVTDAAIEKIAVLASFDAKGLAEVKLKTPISDLNDFDFKQARAVDNFYLMAEVVSSGAGAEKAVARFDEKAAVPILFAVRQNR